MTQIVRPIEIPKIDDAARAYLAALVDHSGSIYFERHKRKNGDVDEYLAVQLSGLAVEVADWVEHRFGNARRMQVGKSTRLTYVTQSALALLSRAYNFLVLKKAQAKIAFQTRNVPRSDRAAVRAVKQECSKILRALKLAPSGPVEEG